MTESIQVYGFGSYFHGKRPARDVDLLLVHRDIGPESSGFAIRCKQLMSAAVSDTDVTMLSLNEEADLQFISKAQAMPLGHIGSETVDRDVERLRTVVVNYPTRNAIWPVGQTAPRSKGVMKLQNCAVTD
jgi:hypothetical protein